MRPETISAEAQPFDPRRLAQLAQGDPDGLVTAVASYACALIQQAGVHPPAAYAGELVSLPPLQAGKAAAGVDLLRLLSHAPQGRKAMRDLGLQPVLHQVEGE